jgi:hypothetical protein
MRSREARELSVKRTERQMAVPPGELQEKAIREFNRLIGGKERDGSLHRLNFLESQIRLLQQEPKRHDQLVRPKAVDTNQRPSSFGEDDC